jgi:hypothetical protein
VPNPTRRGLLQLPGQMLGFAARQVNGRFGGRFGGSLQPFTYCARMRVWSQKRERGIRQPTDSPSQVVVVNAVAASAGRCQRCAPQERCDYSTNLCMPGGVFPPSVSIPPSYASASRIASPKSTNHDLLRRVPPASPFRSKGEVRLGGSWEAT